MVRRLPGETETGEEEFWEVRWLDAHGYSASESYVAISFSSKIKPYLTSLRREFTTYQLDTIRNLKSVYAIRLYEMLSQ